MKVTTRAQIKALLDLVTENREEIAALNRRVAELENGIEVSEVAVPAKKSVISTPEVVWVADEWGLY